MNAVLTLLLDWPVHNWMRRVSLELYQQCGIEMNSAHNAPHLSLRSGFETIDLGHLERYAAQLAASLDPLRVTLTDLKLWANPGEACVLYLDVAEQEMLMPLHHRVTRDLNLPLNDYDGNRFHFHATVMWEPLTAEQLEAVQSQYLGRAFDRQVSIDHLCLYLKVDRSIHTHLILPLGGEDRGRDP
ncbi:MAG: 2'-5' RNA ligase family protein [Meiothermus sp.]|nr:2'-5' RNA ligase family protein [Meiothermus sp.]